MKRTPLSRARCPRTGKRRYGSEYEAGYALVRIHARAADGHVPVRAYECRLCGGGWHLTSDQEAILQPPQPSRRRRRSKPRLTGPATDVRALVLDRDGYCCVRCGRSVLGAVYSLQHRIARGTGGSSRPEINSPANLVAMCGSATTGCHGWATAYADAAAEWGWVLERNHRPALDPAHHPAWAYGRGWVLLDDHGGRHPVAAPHTAA